MQINSEDNNSSQIEQARKLFDYGYLPGPISCDCGANYFKIYSDLSYKVNGCSFRCGNNKCRKKYQITINSFYDNFTKQKLSIMSEIIKCFIFHDYNATRTYKYITEELKHLFLKK